MLPNHCGSAFWDLHFEGLHFGGQGSRTVGSGSVNAHSRTIFDFATHSLDIYTLGLGSGNLQVYSLGQLFWDFGFGNLLAHPTSDLATR